MSDRNNKLLPQVLFSDPVENKGFDCSQDCACPTHFAYGENRYTDRKLVKSRNLRLIPFSQDYKMALNPDGPICVSMLNEPAVELLHQFHQERDVAELQKANGINQESVNFSVNRMVRGGLLINGYEDYLQRNLDSQVLITWLHLTDRCNLRCAYCYLPHEKRDLSRDTGFSLLREIFSTAKSKHFSKIQIKYAGGEPLLQFSLLQDLHAYANELSVRSGITLDEVVLSNGTMISETILTYLTTNYIRLMISMDGLDDIHDAQRVYANGKASSKDVKRAVELALDYGLKPNISVTVTNRNLEGLPLLMRWILERKLQFNLNFFRQNDFAKDDKDLCFNEQQLIEGLLECYKVVEEFLPEQSMLASLADRANLSTSHLRPCGVGKNYLVFDTNGNLSKCQMKMDQPVATQPNGHFISAIQNKKGIQNISVDAKEECSQCEWRYWCAGGCPLEAYNQSGAYNSKSPYCNVYKSIFPEILRLEGLRLIKFAKSESQFLN